MKQLRAADTSLEHMQCVELLRGWTSVDWEDDRAVLSWFEKDGAQIENELSRVRLEAMKKMMKEMMGQLSAENKAELLKEL